MNCIETYPGQDNFHLFQDVLNQLYDANSLRHKQPDSCSEEHLKKCFVLMKDNIAVARLAVYKNPELKYNNHTIFCIGNYECIDDAEIAQQLLKMAENYIKNEKGDFIIGPMNGSSWESYRFSEHNNEPNFFLEPYHHIFYNKQFTDFGFKVLAKYFSSHTYNLNFKSEQVNHLHQSFFEQGVNIRNINLDDYENELSKLYPFLQEAFKTNFLYTPITHENFSKKYIQLKNYINPHFALIAEDNNKNIIGVFFCIHNYYNNASKTLIIKTIARNPRKQWSGLGHVMANIIYKRAAAANYTEIIHAFMFEQGTSTDISNKFLGTPFKKYLLYGKRI